MQGQQGRRGPQEILRHRMEEETDGHEKSDGGNIQSEDRPNQQSNHSELDQLDDGSAGLPPPASRSMSRLPELLMSNIGVLLALASSVLFSCQGVLVTSIAFIIDPFQLSVLLMPILTGGSICLMVINAIAPPKTLRQYIWLLLSGLSLSGLQPLLVLAYRHILYPDVMSINQLSIILVGFLNWIIVREPFRPSHFLLAIVSLVGVFCISRPTFIFGDHGDGQPEDGNRLLGTALALGGASCFAMTLVIVRKQSTVGIHPFQSSFANALVVGVVNGILCATVGEWRCPSIEVWLTIIGIGLIYLAAQTTLYSALARERAPKVSIICTSQVVMSFVLQLLIFRVVPPWTSWLGSLLITVACIGTLVKRSRDSTRSSDPV